MVEQKDSVLTKWLLEKEERFYVLFLVSIFIFFTAMSLLNFALITGGIIAGVWIIFYYTIMRKE